MAPEVEDELEGVTMVLLGSGSSAWRSFTSSWSFLTRERGERTTVVTVAANGGDELRSGVLGRGSRGRGRAQRVRERSEGVEGRCVAFTAASGKRREAGGGAGACRRAANTRPSSFWREEGDDWHRPAGLGWLLVGWTGKDFSLSHLFLFFYFCYYVLI